MKILTNTTVPKGPSDENFKKLPYLEIFNEILLFLIWGRGIDHRTQSVSKFSFYFLAKKVEITDHN